AAGGTNAAASAGLPGPGLQLRGGAQQRGEDAAEPAPEGDAGAVGSQTTVLEPAGFPHRQTEEDLPLRAAGRAVAARAAAGATAPTRARQPPLLCVRPAGRRMRNPPAARPPQGGGGADAAGVRLVGSARRFPLRRRAPAASLYPSASSSTRSPV